MNRSDRVYKLRKINFVSGFNAGGVVPAFRKVAAYSLLREFALEFDKMACQTEASPGCTGLRTAEQCWKNINEPSMYTGPSACPLPTVHSAIATHYATSAVGAGNAIADIVSYVNGLRDGLDQMIANEEGKPKPYTLIFSDGYSDEIFANGTSPSSLALMGWHQALIFDGTIMLEQNDTRALYTSGVKVRSNPSVHVDCNGTDFKWLHKRHCLKPVTLSGRTEDYDASWLSIQMIPKHLNHFHLEARDTP